MSLAATVKAMAAAGMTADQIADVVDRMEEARLSKARAGNAKRQREWRERNANNADNGVTGVTSVTGPSPKERSPTPPKEITPTRSSLRSEHASADDRPKSDFPPGAFSLWYQGYPEKVGRAAAEKSFERIRKAGEATFAQLCEGVRRYIAAKPADRSWCNPATWLNQARWLDQPAPQGGLALVAPDPSEPRVDFGGGVMWPERSVKAVIDHWRRDPTTWPRDRLGPPPGEPGCKLPAKMMEAA